MNLINLMILICNPKLNFFVQKMSLMGGTQQSGATKRITSGNTGRGEHQQPKAMGVWERNVFVFFFFWKN